MRFPKTYNDFDWRKRQKIENQAKRNRRIPNNVIEKVRRTKNCWWCKKPFKMSNKRIAEDIEMHHVIPLSCGGKNIENNIVPVHEEVCHKEADAYSLNRFGKNKDGNN